ncbi:hypothetical protein SLS62_003760 [Diatrype stigma]|uniref:Glutathione S-transferase n=1 Tax=Diatrype stigma TaxID=117547 RepID=A0AAN9UUB3_9PEZI
MMSATKPIKLYGHQRGPHSWKIVIILKELELAYEHVFIPFPDMKKAEYLHLNPNGRAPVIEDPNTGVTIWESGAIAEYLVETYDKEAKLTYTTSPEKWSVKTWELFQVSNQDQYFGQKAYFAMTGNIDHWPSHATQFHTNKNIPTVTAYFGDEVKRSLGVIDRHLGRTGQAYLVGVKCTFADLMYVPFNIILDSVLFHQEGFEAEWEAEFPHAYAWHRRLMERKAVKEALAEKARAEEEMDASGPWAKPYGAR